MLRAKHLILILIITIIIILILIKTVSKTLWVNAYFLLDLLLIFVLENPTLVNTMLVRIVFRPIFTLVLLEYR